MHFAGKAEIEYKEGGRNMRCPKCGYISFDTVGSCKKCHKNIGELVGDLEGTVFDAQAPVFLHIEPGTTSATASGYEIKDEVSISGSEMEELPAFPSGAEEEENDVSADEAAEEEGTLSLDDFDEAEVSGEIILEDDAEDVGTESDDLQLDFGDIDISDLAPPEAGEESAVTGESLNLDEDIEEIAETPDSTEPAPSLVTPGAGLEDLQVDNLDFDSPAPLVSGSKLGEKLMPSVKTGTALDDFDFDLGELITEEK